MAEEQRIKTVGIVCLIVDGPRNQNYLNDNVQSDSASEDCPVFKSAIARLAGKTAFDGSQ